MNECISKKEHKFVGDIYTGTREFKMVCHLRPKRVKDKNDDLLAYCQNILNRWKNYFCQLLNVHDVNEVTQTGMRIAEPLEPETSYLIPKLLLKS
jgi:hypothetical protein